MISEFSPRCKSADQKSSRRSEILRVFLLLAILACLSGCETMDDSPARAAMNAAIPSEQPGTYFIGRRR